MIIYGNLFDEIMLQMRLVYEDHVKYVKEKIRKPCFMDEKQFILFLIKSVEMDSQIASHGCFDILIHTVEALFEEPGIEAADDILLGVKVTVICGSVHSCFFRDLTDGDTVVIF